MDNRIQDCTSLKDLHHALNRNLSRFIAELFKDHLHLTEGHAVFCSDIGQNALHTIQSNTIRGGARGSSTNNILLEASRDFPSVAVSTKEIRR